MKINRFLKIFLNERNTVIIATAIAVFVAYITIISITYITIIPVLFRLMSLFGATALMKAWLGYFEKHKLLLLTDWL